MNNYNTEIYFFVDELIKSFIKNCNLGKVTKVESLFERKKEKIVFIRNRYS